MSTEAYDTPFEREFRTMVRATAHSFGRMAQIIDEEWRWKSKADANRGPGNGRERGLLVICKRCKELINYRDGTPTTTPDCGCGAIPPHRNACYDDSPPRSSTPTTGETEGA